MVSAKKAFQEQGIFRVRTLVVSDFRWPILSAAGQSVGQNQRRLVRPKAHLNAVAAIHTINAIEITSEIRSYFQLQS
jgi:hypothetical protein